MSRKTKRAAAIAVAATVLFTSLAATTTSGAWAQDEVAQTSTSQTGSQEASYSSEDLPKFVADPVVQPLSGEAADADPKATVFVPEDALSLDQLVSAIPDNVPLSEDLQCLAGAVYFESRGEPLKGQLAVARVIVNRAESARFPDTYCGVVYQRAQFSFVRGGKMPTINTSSSAWHKAKAIAQIAHEGLWDSPAKGALFFHATHVAPQWGLRRVAQVNRHIFYR